MDSEVLRYVRRRQPVYHGGRLVPSQLGARRMGGRVEPVTRIEGEIDPSDKGQPVVDDDRLLVVAVHRTLFAVELAANPGPAPQLIAHRTHLPARRPEER
jgi:hypothetical protein